jgi:hypothetical protein
MDKKQPPWERASQQSAWYDDQPFDIGQRVRITDPTEQAIAGAQSGRVVGYDASGPRQGEDFIRVLVAPDITTSTIVALAPAALIAETPEEERAGMAATMLVGLEQALTAEQLHKVLQWLAGPACAKLLDDPKLGVQRIRVGNLMIPGLVLPDLAALARQRLGE